MLPQSRHSLNISLSHYTSDLYFRTYLKRLCRAQPINILLSTGASDQRTARHTSKHWQPAYFVRLLDAFSYLKHPRLISFGFLTMGIKSYFCNFRSTCRNAPKILMCFFTAQIWRLFCQSAAVFVFLPFIRGVAACSAQTDDVPVFLHISKLM